jgi:hypothetical protein
MRILLPMIMLLIFVQSAFAATAQLNAQITINGIPASLAVEQELSLKLPQVNGKTSYIASDLRAVVPALLKVTQEPAFYTITTVPATMTLMNGSATATLSLSCRAITGGYVVNNSQGVDCSNNIMTFDGYVYLSIYPTAATFSSENTVGLYTGTVTVTTDYI